MHRRLSTLMKPQASSSTLAVDEPEKSDTTTPTQQEAAPSPKLKVKRVDYYYSRWSRDWKYRNMNASITVETRPIMKLGDNDPWKDFAFVVVRTVPRPDDMIKEPTFKIVIKSEYILKALKDVIHKWPGVSWNTTPLQMDPEIFLTYMSDFVKYRDQLVSKKRATDEEKHTAASVNVLLQCLSNDYRDTLSNISNLKSHGEITFDLLYSIFVPRSIVVAECRITGELRAFQLISWSKTSINCKKIFQLVCESIDLIDTAANTSYVGRVQTIIHIPQFKGTISISSLDAYPIEFHSQETGLRKALLERGKKWLGLTKAHHMQYKGIAAIKTASCGIVRHNINGRIMIDRDTFKRLNANYVFPQPASTKEGPAQLPYQSYDDYGNPIVDGAQDADATIRLQQSPQEVEIPEEDIILATPVVYGFSLGDKMWMEFNVTKIKPVEWNESAFANLVLPNDRKILLRSLVEAHHRELGFDDFIKGKGHGLVINLFGNPGVGKTFSAEATSEHVKRPLYVVGAGDLGTDATTIDANLERVFDIATAWKAIVLIDEADVFLEQRSLHDLQRNAAVAVFLRHLEYYRGILFLTTNRVRAFDEAFLSRIHVALHFKELDDTSKEQVWTAFLQKVGATNITKEEIKVLAHKDVNGRQIKNAAKTAQSLAAGRGETLALGHFLETLDAMAAFMKEFKAIESE